LTAQREGLSRLGVTEERIYVDHGLTGTSRESPGWRLTCGCPGVHAGRGRENAQLG
jgi:hypothetical protein